MGNQNQEIDIVVFRKGTEGLSTEEYANRIQDRLPNHTVKRARTPAEERAYIHQAKAATGVGINEGLLSSAKALELFVVASSGYGHLPMDTLARMDVTVVNAAGIHAPGIAEQVIGNLLVFARRIHEGWARKESKQWRHYKAREFAGSTVTIVGLGSIGLAVAQRLAGFDVKTIGVRYTPQKGGPTDEIVGFNENNFHDVLARTDYLVLSTPLSDTTEHLIGDSELATLPPHAVLVNVCRGGVLDTEALLSSIQNEEIRGAALDVTDPEPLPHDHALWNMDNVFITPHMGGHTPMHWDRLADILATSFTELEEGVSAITNQVTAGDG